jgi:hypothetical protein
MKEIHSNWQKHDAVIQWCLEEVLGMNEYKVKITYCTLLSGSLGRFLEPNEIQVSQHLDEFDIPRILFHELRHYYQSVTNMFDFDFARYTTIPKTENVDNLSDLECINIYFHTRYDSYLNYPWEIDAREFTTKTYGEYLSLSRKNGIDFFKNR